MACWTLATSVSVASVLCLHAVAWRWSAYQDVIVLAVEQQQYLTSDALTTEYRRQDFSLCTCAAEQSFLDDGQIGQGFALICVSFSSSHRVYKLR